MRIGIVGDGYVGKAMARFLEHSHAIQIFDKLLVDFNSLKKRDAINNCDLVFVCVPTPFSSNTLCSDSSAVSEAVEWIDAPICIKSTVLPGTTRALRTRTGKHLVFSPEYLGEALNHPWHSESACGFLILGGDGHEADLVISAYRPIVDTGFQFIRTDSTTAELCKYMVNCFLATKVAFVNQFYDIATFCGIDFEELRKLWLVDPRIGESHSQVTKERGFGGRCLPKDLEALVSFVDSTGRTPLLEAILAYNKELRSRSKADH